MKKDAIVGCAFGYSNKDIEIFLNSLQQVGYKDDLILFVNDKSAILNKEYSYKLVLINPDAEFKKYKALRSFVYVHKLLKKAGLGENKKTFLSKALSALEKKEQLKKSTVAYFYFTHHLWTSRFFLYYYFLYNASYNRIFLSDVSDVFFQKHPFTDIEEEKVYVFSENVNVTLGNEHNTCYWIRVGFGEEALAKLYNKPVFCAGTIVGSEKSMNTFLREFLIRIIHNKTASWLIGVDQGLFNYMISFEDRDYFSKFENGRLVLTVGILPINEIRIVDGAVYFTANDTLPTVIHQFNRHKNLHLLAIETFSNS